MSGVSWQMIGQFFRRPWFWLLVCFVVGSFIGAICWQSGKVKGPTVFAGLIVFGLIMVLAPKVQQAFRRYYAKPDKSDSTGDGRPKA